MTRTSRLVAVVSGASRLGGARGGSSGAHDDRGSRSRGRLRIVGDGDASSRAAFSHSVSLVAGVAVLRWCWRSDSDVDSAVDCCGSCAGTGGNTNRGHNRRSLSRVHRNFSRVCPGLKC